MEEQNPNPAFEREKWEAALVRQDKELSIKERDLDLRRQEATRSRWSTPLGLAILGAILAALGTVLTTYLTGVSQQNLEEKTAESQRILEMIRNPGGSPDKAADNLRFLVDTKLISPERQKEIQAYLDNRKPGQGAALESPGICVARGRGQPCAPGMVCDAPGGACVPAFLVPTSP